MRRYGAVVIGAVVSLAVFLAPVGWARAQDAPPPGPEASPAAVPAGEPEAPKPAVEQISAEVIELEGLADVQLPGGEWVPAEVGTLIPPGGTVFTSYESMATVKFENNAVLVVGPLAELAITEFLKDADTYVSRLKLNTGEIRFKVLEGDFRTDMKVSTPNATASVTGTEVRQIATSPDLGDNFWIEEGSVDITSRGRVMDLAGGERTTQELLQAIDVARMERVTDLSPAGVTAREEAAALTSTEPASILPGDKNVEEGNPARRRIIEAQNPETIQRVREERTDQPPP